MRPTPQRKHCLPRGLGRKCLPCVSGLQSRNIRPPCAIAPRSGGRRCAFCMLSVSRANVAAKRRKGEEPPFPPSKYARVRPARHCGRTVLRACQTIPRLPAEKYPGDRTPTLPGIPQAISVKQFPWSRNTDRKYPDHPGGVTVDPRRLGPTVTPPSNRRESLTKRRDIARSCRFVAPSDGDFLIRPSGNIRTSVMLCTAPRSGHTAEHNITPAEQTIRLGVMPGQRRLVPAPHRASQRRPSGHI